MEMDPLKVFSDHLFVCLCLTVIQTGNFVLVRKVSVTLNLSERFHPIWAILDASGYKLFNKHNS